MAHSCPHNFYICILLSVRAHWGVLTHIQLLFILFIVFLKLDLLLGKQFYHLQAQLCVKWQFTECIRGSFRKFCSKFIMSIPMPPGFTCSSNSPDSYSRKASISLSPHWWCITFLTWGKPQNKAKPIPLPSLPLYLYCGNILTQRPYNNF